MQSGPGHMAAVTTMTRLAAWTGCRHVQLQGPVTHIADDGPGGMHDAAVVVALACLDGEPPPHHVQRVPARNEGPSDGAESGMTWRPRCSPHCLLCCGCTAWLALGCRTCGRAVLRHMRAGWPAGTGHACSTTLPEPCIHHAKVFLCHVAMSTSSSGSRHTEHDRSRGAHADDASTGTSAQPQQRCHLPVAAPLQITNAPGDTSSVGQ